MFNPTTWEAGVKEKVPWQVGLFLDLQDHARGRPCSDRPVGGH